ncbi:hypothetical protein [Arthrobacter sp. KBS0703]|uniref:hypothetical protein n=1 Tax=Arthrobacter sp. KBS0703 TaxID=1955698 RepID=UPI00163DAC17|nr:hypothetical protein [Arthrobacter sp. KBS0703]
MNAHPSLWRGLASAVLATGVLAGCSPAPPVPTAQPAPATANAPVGHTPACLLYTSRCV